MDNKVEEIYVCVKVAWMSVKMNVVWKKRLILFRIIKKSLRSPLLAPRTEGTNEWYPWDKCCRVSVKGHIYCSEMAASVTLRDTERLFKHRNTEIAVIDWSADPSGPLSVLWGWFIERLSTLVLLQLHGTAQAYFLLKGMLHMCLLPEWPVMHPCCKQGLWCLGLHLVKYCQQAKGRDPPCCWGHAESAGSSSGESPV